LPLRHLDDLVEERLVAVPRIGIGGGVFLGRNAAGSNAKSPASSGAAVIRTPFSTAGLRRSFSDASLA